jgi:glycerophosphoryl diester phosphodiesterase
MTVSIFTLNLLLIIATSLLFCSSPILKNMNINRKIELHGHRGARGLMPENTIPAFQKAIDLGMNFLELDVVLTKDKEIIVHHDTEVNTKICIHKEGKPLKKDPISTWTLSQIKELDCGSIKNIRFPEQQMIENTSIPTLKEVISFVKNYEKNNPGKTIIKLNIEMKFPDVHSKSDIEEFVGLIAKLLEDEKIINDSVIQSFEISAIKELKKRNPKITTSALFAPTKYELLRLQYFSGKEIRSTIIQKGKEADASYISPYYPYVTEDFVNLAHTSGLKVLPWTVNTKEEMIRLHNCGVDGIISDYPNLLKELFINEVKK